jgi:hypothetical protein
MIPRVFQLRQEKSQQSLYVTLVDFLIQLLFLGLLMSVIYAVNEAQADATQADVQKERDELKIAIERLHQATGTSDLAEVQKRVLQLTRIQPLLGVQSAAEWSELEGRLREAGPLNQALSRASEAKAISQFVDAAGGIQNARRVLEEQVKKGQFKPACEDNIAKIAVLRAHADHLTVDAPLSAAFLRLLEQLKVDASRVSRMTFDEFSQAFRPILTLYPDCRFNVTVIEYTPFKKPRDVVRQFFYAFNVDAGR